MKPSSDLNGTNKDESTFIHVGYPAVRDKPCDH
jgi:hypothetical protein